MNSTLLDVLVTAAILGGAWAVTNLFARWMYIVCPECHTLNARRRIRCRRCNAELRTKPDEVSQV